MTMRTNYYKVAEQVFAFRTQDDDKQNYIPSCEPFVYTPAEGEAILFTLTVDDSFSPAQKGELIGEFPCGGADFNVYRLADGSYQFLIAPPGGEFCGLLQANAQFSEATLALHGNEWARAFAANNSIMLLYAFAAADKNTLLFHASVIENDGYGYLFLGKSGTGKSTHSSLWLKHIAGSELMNDDNPVVVATEQGAIIYGSPWSGKTPCYRNISAPVGAFVRIRQEKVNHITRDKTLEALSALLPSVSSMKWDDRVYNGIYDSISLLIAHVPCYTLGCRPDQEAAEVCYQAVKVNK
jgi:Serine kinase of the HPr protein, regulates carbohydrate metabolism